MHNSDDYDAKQICNVIKQESGIELNETELIHKIRNECKDIKDESEPFTIKMVALKNHSILFQGSIRVPAMENGKKVNVVLGVKCKLPCDHEMVTTENEIDRIWDFTDDIISRLRFFFVTIEPNFDHDEVDDDIEDLIAEYPNNTSICDRVSDFCFVCMLLFFCMKHLYETFFA